MPGRPSKNEEEYFAREEAARKHDAALQHAASQHAAHEPSAPQEAPAHAHHHLHCPNCGTALRAEHHHGVRVERCHECHGVWLDAAEVARLLDKPESATAIFLRDFAGLLSKKRLQT